MLYNANVVCASTLDFVDVTVHNGQRIHIFADSHGSSSLFVYKLHVHIHVYTVIEVVIEI